MQAWLSLSEKMTSPRWATAWRTPWLVMYPVENRTQASLRMYVASRSSNSRWRSSVPLRKRLPVHPVPYLSMAALAASRTRGSLVRPR